MCSSDLRRFLAPYFDTMRVLVYLRRQDMHAASVYSQKLRGRVITPPALQMVSEDFAYYQKEIPGFYFFVGLRNEAKGITAMWHTEFYDMDEAALPIGVRAMSNVVLDFLAR